MPLPETLDSPPVLNLERVPPGHNRRPYAFHTRMTWWTAVIALTPLLDMLATVPAFGWLTWAERDCMRPSMGIYCLEGDWELDLRHKATVEPILELLEALGVAEYIHRNAVKTDQFKHYLKEWTKRRYDKYSVLYLAAHGAENGIHLGQDWISLEDIAAILKDKVRGGVIHFASCSTLDIEDAELMAFAKTTGATAVTGYRHEVGWTESAAFETLMLERLSQGARTDAFYNGLTKDYGSLAQRLGLVAATPRRVYSSQG